MRIYAVADIHGKPDRISTIMSNILTHAPDLLILAGDISNFFNRKPVMDFIRELPLPCAGIMGNSDFRFLTDILNVAPNFTLLGATPFQPPGPNVSTVRIFGLSGTIPLPFASRICIREKQTLARLEKTILPSDILVVHPPPRGILDKVGGKFHAGSFNLRRFLDAHPLSLILCGHIHEQSGTAVQNTTRVVNCAMGSRSQGALIDFDKKTRIHVTLLTDHDSSLSI